MGGLFLLGKGDATSIEKQIQDADNELVILHSK